MNSVFLTLLITFLQLLVSYSSPPPNILILLVDDMGYSDTATFGATNVSTPHIDNLVASGMKMTHWISAAPICTPSRASIQTGRYPIRTGCMGNVERYRVIPTPANPGGLDSSTERSLARALKEQGNYSRTGYSGKWHLGINHVKQDRHYTPIAHGYDTFKGAPWTNAPMCAMDSDGRSMKYKSGPKFCFMTENDTVVEMPLRIENFTRTITDHTIDFFRERANARDLRNVTQPWFFFHSWFHVHTPLFTNRTNRGRSEGGTFGDNVEELDDSVGAIMNALRMYGFANNTFIVWTSDNGPYQEEGWENSGRTNIYSSVKENGKNEWIGRMKGGKGQLFEGGIRMPAAVIWPGHIPSGSISNTMVSSMDIFPTVMSLAAGGIHKRNDIEDDAANFPIVDGKSFLPIVLGKTNKTSHDVFLHYCGFNIIGARVNGRFKVFFATQKWYTNDKLNSSICVECCNGINPFSIIVTGAPASELCGCQDKDLNWLNVPIVYDMELDQLEMRPLTSEVNWPNGTGTSYMDVVSKANETKNEMKKIIPTQPNKSGAGVCTAGIPSGNRQPCCRGCSEMTFLGKCRDSKFKECECGQES
jgi:arylsulfatase A-like enzyme